MKKELMFWLWVIFVVLIGWFVSYITGESYIACSCFIMLTVIARHVWH